MAKTLKRVIITPPSGEPVTIHVKRSTMLLLEEEMGRPIVSEIEQGFTSTLYRYAYRVGRDHGVIPADLSFVDFVDSDDVWDFELGSVDDDKPAESADPN